MIYRSVLATCLVFGCLFTPSNRLFAQGDTASESTERPIVHHSILANDTIWTTPAFIIDSEVEGPKVLIVGGMHGNEPAGYRAAEQIRHWPVQRGAVAVIPMANVDGLARNRRRLADEAGEQGDLNRHFPIPPEVVAPQGELAEAIWEFTLDFDPDWVIDLHEGYEFHRSHRPSSGKRSVGSSIIHRANETTTPLVGNIIRNLNSTIENEDRHFDSLGGGPVHGSLVHACISELGCQGFILETTFKDQAISLRTRQHRMMVSHILMHLGVIDSSCVDITCSTSDDVLDIGLFVGPGTTANGRNRVTRLVDESNQMSIQHFDQDDVSERYLGQFDLVIFPGGSGSAQGNAIGESGREVIRQFIRNGGDCIGICAGAYLCSAHYRWSLHVIDTHVFTGARETPDGPKQMWYRGGPTSVQMEFTDNGAEIFYSLPSIVDVRYQNGPIVSRKHDDALPDYEILAYFRSENARYPVQVGTMVDTPAIVTGRFGSGDVVSVSPHPEATEALTGMVPTLIHWCLEREQSSN